MCIRDRLKAEEKQERNAIEGLILQLSDPDERAVIRLRYFDRADWDGICACLLYTSPRPAAARATS